MTEVILTEWTPGIKTIALVQLVMLSCGVGLVKAKSQVDALINGERQSFQFEFDHLAQQFKQAAIALGARSE